MENTNFLLVYGILATVYGLPALVIVISSLAVFVEEISTHIPVEGDVLFIIKSDTPIEDFLKRIAISLVPIYNWAIALEIILEELDLIPRSYDEHNVDEIFQSLYDRQSRNLQWLEESRRSSFRNEVG